MFNTAFRITFNRDDAADAVQEAFISVFRNLNNLKEEGSFGAWLKRIVINKSLNILKARKTGLFVDDEGIDVPDESEIYPENTLEVATIKNAIARLPDGYRTVLSLYLLEGYDHEEIASILGVSESTSKSQLNRSKKKLRELLKEGVDQVKKKQHVSDGKMKKPNL